MFYDTFSTTPELLTKIVAKARALEGTGSPLAYGAMSEPMTVAWRSDFDEQMQHRFVAAPAAIEVHVIPIGMAARSMRVMAELAEALPSRVRESGVVPADGNCRQPPVVN